MIAKTVSPCLRFIRFTEPVVIIEVTSPALVRMTISDTTLSETIFSIMPGKRFRMLVLMVVRRMYYRTTSTVIIMPLSSCFCAVSSAIGCAGCSLFKPVRDLSDQPGQRSEVHRACDAASSITVATSFGRET